MLVLVQVRVLELTLELPLVLVLANELVVVTLQSVILFFRQLPVLQYLDSASLTDERLQPRELFRQCDGAPFLPVTSSPVSHEDA